MTQVTVRPYRDADFDGVDALWREAFPNYEPRNFAENAVPKKLEVQPELLLVAVNGDEVIGTTMAGYDGHRGWLYSVAVLEAYRGTGVGALLLQSAEERLRALGCAKINIQVNEPNKAVVGFYEKLGYASNRALAWASCSSLPLLSQLRRSVR
ncbi:MAG: GNAT family acetyltransferase [Alphaproteobacteria bacterium]